MTQRELRNIIVKQLHTYLAGPKVVLSDQTAPEADIGRVKRLIIKNCIHAISSILNIYIEGFSSVRLRKNHLFDHAIVLTK